MGALIKFKKSEEGGSRDLATFCLRFRRGVAEQRSEPPIGRDMAKLVSTEERCPDGSFKVNRVAEAGTEGQLSIACQPFNINQEQRKSNEDQDLVHPGENGLADPGLLEGEEVDHGELVVVDHEEEFGRRMMPAQLPELQIEDLVQILDNDEQRARALAEARGRVQIFDTGAQPLPRRSWGSQRHQEDQNLVSADFYRRVAYLRDLKDRRRN
ncbi:unnamed protein product [Bursaphelenchus okinawaensis]|uniref:Uncharacterized protein n=1 Tax=Bursaphelenchus okinawaensis TaxID=465554 RepID=A0A811K3U4_9BILA|nr:unnamed protein product [Bursaphelenchus okinawaensis]CAG9091189.1 unnamed protein product [Bursaphelenchus okinawaensis]